MKTTEPANIERQRAMPRTCSARSFGYACLILIALVSRDAVAQAIVVTLEPGEYERSIAMAGSGTRSIDLRTPGHICNWPSMEELRASLSTIFTVHVERLEAFGSATGADIVQAMNVIVGQIGNIGAPGRPVYLFTGGTRVLPPEASGTRAETFAVRCLDLANARIGLFQIRRWARANRGMPAPAVDPTVFEMSAPTKPAGGAPPSLGAPAPAPAQAR